MDLATSGGIILAAVSLILGFTFDGGSLAALFNPSAVLIIVGGTLGATMTSVSLKNFLKLPVYLKVALFQKKVNYQETIDQLIELATVARREGILALEERISEYPDPFLRNGIQLIVDGVDPELVKNMLDTELSFVESRHEVGAKMFEAAGGFSPTMGIIGTVMGLVHVLGNLKNVDELGPEIATAFTATLYGVALANVFWLPVAHKLKSRNEEEMLLRELSIEGILSIQAGENPNILRQKLKAFLAPADRESKQSARAGEAGAETAEA